MKTFKAFLQEAKSYKWPSNQSFNRLSHEEKEFLQKWPQKLGDWELENWESLVSMEQRDDFIYVMGAFKWDKPLYAKFENGTTFYWIGKTTQQNTVRVYLNDYKNPDRGMVQVEVMKYNKPSDVERLLKKIEATHKTGKYERSS